MCARTPDSVHGNHVYRRKLSCTQHAIWFSFFIFPPFLDPLIMQGGTGNAQAPQRVTCWRDTSSYPESPSKGRGEAVGIVDTARRTRARDGEEGGKGGGEGGGALTAGVSRSPKIACVSLGCAHAYAHTLCGHTHTMCAHTHTICARTHTLCAHTHAECAHTHTVCAHTHTI